MLRILVGFVSGVYVGTYYNCKPIIERLKDCIKSNIPEIEEIREKNSEDKKKD